MKCYIPLQKRFRELDISTREWLPNSGYPRSRDTANVILCRTDAVEPVAFAYMSHCLGFTNKEVLAHLELYLKERPDKKPEIKILQKFIAPVEVTAEEQTMLNRMRTLPANKRKVILDMLKTLEP